MNFITKNNQKIPRRTDRRLDANAKAWLAQFPKEPGASSTNGGHRLGSPRQPSTGTTSSSFLLNSLTNQEPLVYLALSVGRGHASTEVGLATLDVHSPSIVLSQFSDDLWFNGLLTKISLFEPQHLLLPNTLCDIQPAPRVLTYIRNNFPDLTIVPLERIKFNSHRGAQQLEFVCADRFAPLIQTNQQLYYAMTSAAALLDHVQQHVVRAAFGEHTLRLHIESKTGSMLIDVESAHRLELLYPLYPSPERRTCLYGVLNTCVTRIGQRNLRAKVLQPSCNVDVIQTMHESVAELRAKERQIVELQQLLRPFVSVDRLTRIAYVVPPNKDDNYRVSELLINQALQLKLCLDSIPDMFRVLTELDGSVFAQIREGLQDPRYPYLAKKIHEVVDSNGGAEVCRAGAQFFQRLYAVRPGLNGMLDLNRTIYTALVDDIRSEVQRLKDAYNAPLRLSYSKSRQFHVQMPLRSGGVCVDRLVAELEVLSHSKNMLLLTNEELCKLNIRIKKYIDEIHFTSTAILCDLLQGIRQEMNTIYDLTGYISELDITLAIVKLSLNPEFCRPTFGDDMRLIQAVHPFLEYASHKTHSLPVPNNVLATAEYNFFIITGPNMGGKTIYLKMVALLQILAQIGCYVPAKSAQFRMCDRLFTRMGFNDSIEQSASSYVVEMREMDYILKSVTPNSLVIIDELCRSTNANDSQRIAWRICEQLLTINGPKLNDIVAENEIATGDSGKDATRPGYTTAPFVFFTTHFLGLCRLYERYLNVVNLNFVAVEKLNVDGKLHLTYVHQLQEGETTIKGYGLALARTVRFPPKIMPRAEALYSCLISSLPADILPPANTHSNFAPLLHSRSSNPINRTYSSSNRSIAIANYHRNVDDIGGNKRNLYDLYANVMEVFRCQTDDDAFQDGVNTLLMQFMENCDAEMGGILRADAVDVMLGRFFVDREEPRIAPRVQMAVKSNGHVHDISAPISFRDDFFGSHDGAAEAITHSSNVRDVKFYDGPGEAINVSRNDRSVTFSTNVQCREIEAYPSELEQRDSSNRTNQWSEHSLISNLNYETRRRPIQYPSTSQSQCRLSQSQMPFNRKRTLTQRGLADLQDHFHNVSNYNNLFEDSITNYNNSGRNPIRRRVPSETETNMSRPSFKSFINGFARTQPSQMAPQQTVSTSSASRTDQSQANNTNMLTLRALMHNQVIVKPRPAAPTNTINYFADMPDTFWKSMDEFENGSQFAELCDFVNEGIPPVWPNANNSLGGVDQREARASSQRGERQRNSVALEGRPEFEVPPWSTPVQYHGYEDPEISKALPIDHQTSCNNSMALVTPNIFDELENFVNRSSTSDTCILPTPSRPDISSQLPDTLNTQNTINFMVEFESSLTKDNTIESIFDDNDGPFVHSIFGLIPNEKDQPMEHDNLDLHHRTQSRETESSLNEMDATQHVITLMSQSSSQQEGELCKKRDSTSIAFDVSDPPSATKFHEADAPQSFVFRMPTPRTAVHIAPKSAAPMRSAMYPSPTQSENRQRIEAYVDSQYDRAVRHPQASATTSSSLTTTNTFRDASPPPPLLDQCTEIHSTSSSPRPLRPLLHSDATFQTPTNRRIQTPSGANQTTMRGVADSLRRYIDSNRDSDDDNDEDMFADSISQHQSQGIAMNQQGEHHQTSAVVMGNVEENELMVMDIDSNDVLEVEILVPPPEEFQ